MNTNRPRFIVLDGMDGTGKSTQLRMLSDYLTGLGIAHITTAEPSDLPEGKAIRAVLSGAGSPSNGQIAAMFLLDRISHNREVIAPALSAGKWVLCDRYYTSSLAYQGTDERTFDWVLHANLDCPEIRHPDTCLLFDMDPERSMNRIMTTRRDTPTEIFETLEQQRKIRLRYEYMRNILVSQYGDSIVTVDADATPDTVFSRILKALDIDGQ